MGGCKAKKGATVASMKNTCQGVGFIIYTYISLYFASSTTAIDYTTFNQDGVIYSMLMYIFYGPLMNNPGPDMGGMGWLRSILHI
jgi:hypothetical protein